MKENNLFKDVVVVADDFTGANDAGVSPALRGKKVSVAFHTPFTQPVDALVINTDSRALRAAEAAEKSGRTRGGSCGCALAHQKD